MGKGVMKKRLSMLTSPAPLDALEEKPVTWLAHKETVHSLISGIENDSKRVLCSRVFDALLKERELVRVITSHSSSSADSYDVYIRHFNELTFRPITMINLKYELLLAAGELLSDKTQDSLLDTFFSTIPPIEHEDRRFMGISDNLYWDKEKQTLVSALELGHHRCFMRLFDTPKDEAVGGIQYFPVSIFDLPFSEQVRKEYASLLQVLNSLEEPAFSEISSLPPASNLKFILEWANDNLGLYWDIITMFATVFMKKKPLGAYFLIGLTRNGKSTCVNLLHTTFGTANTSMVDLSELGDHHKSATMRYSILNAPDDEEDDITRFQKEFKKLSGHQSVSVSKMRSNEPFKISGAAFTMVFPMNTIPQWRGSSAAACAKRTIIIPFTRDFTKSDKAIGSFEERAFVPTNLCTLVAHAMALATFFAKHPEAFGYSEASMSQQQTILNENGSVATYRRLFDKYFDGFSDWKTLYDDYQQWCMANEFKYKDKGSLKLAFQEYCGEDCRRNQTYKTKTGQRSDKARRIKGPLKKLLMMPQAYIDDLKEDIDTLHENGYSAVERLAWLEEEQKGIHNG